MERQGVNTRANSEERRSEGGSVSPDPTTDLQPVARGRTRSRLTIQTGSEVRNTSPPHCSCSCHREQMFIDGFGFPQLFEGYRQSPLGLPTSTDSELLTIPDEPNQNTSYVPTDQELPTTSEHGGTRSFDFLFDKDDVFGPPDEPSQEPPSPQRSPTRPSHRPGSSLPTTYALTDPVPSIPTITRTPASPERIPRSHRQWLPNPDPSPQHLMVPPLQPTARIRRQQQQQQQQLQQQQQQQQRQQQQQPIGNAFCQDPQCHIPSLHNEGLYLHSGQRPAVPDEWFGYSDPPPEIRERFERVKSGMNSEADFRSVIGFLVLHAGGHSRILGD